MTDLTKFNSDGSMPVGCMTGQHDFDEKSLRLEEDGDLTKFVGTCKRCMTKIGISSPIGMNRAIRDMNKISGSDSDVIEPVVRVNSDNNNQSNTRDDEIISKLFGL